MAYKNDDHCIKKAYDDERLFVLMARDPAAPGAILQWIFNSIDSQPPEKIREALDCALEMKARGQEFRDQKAADQKNEAELKERDEFEHWKKRKEQSTLRAQTTRLTDLPFGSPGSRLFEKKVSNDAELTVDLFVREQELEKMIIANIMNDCEDNGGEVFRKTDAINYRNYVAELQEVRKKLGR